MRSCSRIVRKHLGCVITQSQTPQPNLFRNTRVNADSLLISLSLLSSRDFSYSSLPLAYRDFDPLNVHSERRKELAMSITGPNLLAARRNLTAPSRPFFPWTRDTPYTQPY